MQTLEPRMLYVHVPFEDQSDLPVFDTILPDFNLIQLFRKYQFVGPDRIADTDQFSFGVTTRLIDADDGRRAHDRNFRPNPLSKRAAREPAGRLAERRQRVGLRCRNVASDCATTGISMSAINGTAIRIRRRAPRRASSTGRRHDRLFGFGYRYRRGLLEQGDLSLVWPVAERWRVIGRYSYSFLDKQPLEQFVGWEYEACCWRFRMVGRRYVSRRTGEADSSISLQLELKGLSQGAISPEDLLDRGILGYRSIARAN